MHTYLYTHKYIYYNKNKFSGINEREALSEIAKHTCLRHMQVWGANGKNFIRKYKFLEINEREAKGESHKMPLRHIPVWNGKCVKFVRKTDSGVNDCQAPSEITENAFKIYHSMETTMYGYYMETQGYEGPTSVNLQAKSQKML